MITSGSDAFVLAREMLDKETGSIIEAGKEQELKKNASTCCK